VAAKTRAREAGAACAEEEVAAWVSTSVRKVTTRTKMWNTAEVRPYPIDTAERVSQPGRLGGAGKTIIRAAHVLFRAKEPGT
jgi:hypothetical protein